jgi:hypothetical protein
MKARDSRLPDSPFNPPSVMKARALFMLQFVALIGGLMSAEAAVAEQAWRLAGCSLLCFALMIGVRRFLRRTAQWEICVDGLNRSFAREDPRPDEEESSVRLMQLLDRLETMEQSRGRPDFDLWALQELRHEIAVLVKTHPALESLVNER